MELDKLTEEMFSFLKEKFNVSREQVLDLNNNEELRQHLLKELTWIECDAFENETEEELVRSGELASQIITYISYKP